METSIVFAVMLIAITVVFPNANALPTIDAEDKRESNFATRDVNFPLQDTLSIKNMDMLGRLLYLTQKYRHQMSALADQKFKRQEDIIPCLWNAVSCYRKRK